MTSFAAERALGASGSGRSLRRWLVGSLFLLALVPFAATLASIDSYVATQERERADEGLDLTLRATAAEYADILRERREAVIELAGARSLRRALVADDRGALERLARRRGAGVTVGNKLVVSAPPRSVAIGAITVARGRRELARLVVTLPPDRALLDRLTANVPALARPGQLVVARGGEISAGPRGLLGTTLTDAADTYRVASTALVGEQLQLAAVVSKRDVDARGRELRVRLVRAGGGALLVLLALAAVLARPLSRRLGDVAADADRAGVDAQTNLANRRRFEEVLAHEIKRADRTGRPFALVLADLDDFKEVNDRFGHQVGDEVLTHFAKLLREQVRTIDLAARYGGEEFALILAEADVDAALRLAERLRDGLARWPIVTAAGRVEVTASFGVAAYPASPREGVVAAADRALYRAKAAGKNRAAAEVASGSHLVRDEP